MIGSEKRIPEIDYEELVNIIESEDISAESKLNAIIKYRDRMWLRAVGFSEEGTPDEYYVQEAVHRMRIEEGIDIDDGRKYLY